ncbi:MAG: phage head-tail connector protein, partial [Bacillota bacterium]
MAVSAAYLAKIRRAVRRNTDTDVDAELTDIIEECRLDLQQLGVLESRATDETDSLILGAVRCFARWKFGLSNEDAEANREDYMMLRDEL